MGASAGSFATVGGTIVAARYDFGEAAEIFSPAQRNNLWLSVPFRSFAERR
jgi:hypothetical protein